MLYEVFSIISIIKSNGLKFFSNFYPNGTPTALVHLIVSIECVSNISRPIALGVRLAANISAGLILTSILISLYTNIILTNIFYISFIKNMKNIQFIYFLLKYNILGIDFIFIGINAWFAPHIS